MLVTFNHFKSTVVSRMKDRCGNLPAGVGTASSCHPSGLKQPVPSRALSKWLLSTVKRTSSSAANMGELEVGSMDACNVVHVCCCRFMVPLAAANANLGSGRVCFLSSCVICLRFVKVCVSC